MLMKIKEAAQMLGISSSTFYRRLSNPIDPINDYIEIVSDQQKTRIISESIARYIENKIRINRV